MKKIQGNFINYYDFLIFFKNSQTLAKYKKYGIIKMLTVKNN